MSQFSQRVVIQWNALPYNVVNASSVNAFKSSLDKIPTEYMSALEFIYIIASVLNRFDIIEIPGSDIYQYQSYEDILSIYQDNQ